VRTEPSGARDGRTQPDPVRGPTAIPAQWVYVLEVRLGRKGKRTKRDHWHPVGAYLTRAEAEAVAKANDHRYPHGWRVCGVPAGGALAELVPAA
jgi:hypothetical protein